MSVHLQRAFALATIGLATIGLAPAQINVFDKIEQKGKERLERKVDRAIDKGFDKTEEGVDKGAKEATKGGKNKGNKKTADVEEGGAGSSPASGPAAKAGQSAKPALKAYSKFDFIPGDKLIAYEDFSQDAVGDFPARWNTNNTGEVVTVEGAEGKWLKLVDHGWVYPEFVGTLPEDFTLEYDAIVLADMSNCADHRITFHSKEGPVFNWDWNGWVSLSLNPRGASAESTPYVAVSIYDANVNSTINNSNWKDPVGTDMHPPISRISIQRQKNRLRLYLNEEKIWDLPRAFANGVDYQFGIEHAICPEQPLLVSNLRVAVGAPDTRNKLITEGRLVTRGILFGSGKDQVKPESYGTLKEIASVLQENPSVKVRIIGHTDSDGDDAANLALSKRRAAAVKAALSAEFKVDAARMEADGKGEAEPVAPNTTPEGKASNRRVEFVKM